MLWKDNLGHFSKGIRAGHPKGSIEGGRKEPWFGLCKRRKPLDVAVKEFLVLLQVTGSHRNNQSNNTC